MREEPQWRGEMVSVVASVVSSVVGVALALAITGWLGWLVHP